MVVLKAGASRSPDDVANAIVQRVRETIGPIACFRSVAVVSRLPKTRSGKILRGTMKKIAEGTLSSVPPTIDDPAILDEIRVALRPLGYPAVTAPE